MRANLLPSVSLRNRGSGSWNASAFSKALGLLILLLPLIASAQITLESGIGHQGEIQYRAGYDFRLSDHWQLDTGLTAVRYKDERCSDGVMCAPSGHVFALDAVLLRQIALGHDFYLVLGSGPAVWNHARFGAQAHGHAWMFSNRIGLNWEVSEHLQLGIGVRHYSCLWCRPNSSIDFIGLQAGYRF